MTTAAGGIERRDQLQKQTGSAASKGKSHQLWTRLGARAYMTSERERQNGTSMRLHRFWRTLNLLLSKLEGHGCGSREMWERSRGVV